MGVVLVLVSALGAMVRGSADGRHTHTWTRNKRRRVSYHRVSSWFEQAEFDRIRKRIREKKWALAWRLMFRS